MHNAYFELILTSRLREVWSEEKTSLKSRKTDTLGFTQLKVIQLKLWI